MLRVARIVVGVFYVLAGLAKPFPQIEDVAEVLALASQANQGTVLAPVSEILAANGYLVGLAVGAVMVTTGLAFIFNRFVVVAASIQIVMLVCFVTFLYRLHNVIIWIDLPFFLVALAVILQALKRDKGGAAVRP